MQWSVCISRIYLATRTWKLYWFDATLVYSTRYRQANRSFNMPLLLYSSTCGASRNAELDGAGIIHSILLQKNPSLPWQDTTQVCNATWVDTSCQQRKRDANYSKLLCIAPLLQTFARHGAQHVTPAVLMTRSPWNSDTKVNVLRWRWSHTNADRVVHNPPKSSKHVRKEQCPVKLFTDCVSCGWSVVCGHTLLDNTSNPWLPLGEER